MQGFLHCANLTKTLGSKSGTSDKAFRGVGHQADRGHGSCQRPSYLVDHQHETGDKIRLSSHERTERLGWQWIGETYIHFHAQKCAD